LRVYSSAATGLRWASALRETAKNQPTAIVSFLGRIIANRSIVKFAMEKFLLVNSGENKNSSNSFLFGQTSQSTTIVIL